MSNRHWWVGGAFLAIACAPNAQNESGEADVASLSQALTPTQTRVLGFETPTADWTPTVGTVGQSTTHTQGSFALSIAPNGWTEIGSRLLDSLGPVKNTLSYDIRLPATVAWGETRAVIKVPSLGINWQELGTFSLVGRAANTFHKVTLPVPASLATVLGGTYTDLQVRIIINAAPTTGSYLLDNIDIAQPSGGGAGGASGTGGAGAGGGGAGGAGAGAAGAGAGGAAGSAGSAGSAGTGQVVTDSLSITLPTVVAPQDAFMSSSQRMQIDARVVLGAASALEHVSNLGSLGLELGSIGFAHANLYNAAGPTELRSQSTVRGFVRANGTIGKQPPVTIQGGEFQNTPVPATTLSWPITWPPSSTGDVILHQPPGDATLAPGRKGRAVTRAGGASSVRVRRVSCAAAPTFAMAPAARALRAGAPRPWRRLVRRYALVRSTSSSCRTPRSTGSIPGTASPVATRTGWARPTTVAWRYSSLRRSWPATTISLR
jgi:hypothetical protein